jgi:hypothetical protein
MTKKIEIVGTQPRKIVILDRPKKRMDPEQFAAALGSTRMGVQAKANLDAIALAELGTQLSSRLRSSGGRPALEDAAVNCRVPLSAEDEKILEGMVAQIGQSTGAKPSVGQLVSVIVHQYLTEISSNQSTREAS